MAQMQITHEQRQVNHFVEELEGVELPLQMIQIPAGTFVMGAPESEKNSEDYERPQHLVSVSSFFMGRYPVTNTQWDFVVSLPQERRKLDAKNEPKKAKHPVVYVSWYDAIEFCARLSRHTGKQYRLPSEAEWEYACRAITSDKFLANSSDLTIENWNREFIQPFHFGETISSQVANYGSGEIYGRESAGEYRGKIVAVDYFSQAANNFGLSQMHGNVWEWCADPWNDGYKKAPIDGLVWDKENQNDNHYQNILENLSELLDDGRKRILRGGSYYNVPRYCRSAFRFRNNPDNDDDNFGFRLAVSDPRTL